MARSSTKRVKKHEPAVSTVIPLPESPVPALMQSAIALYREGKHAEAIKAYDGVLKVSPNRISAIVNKGVALRHMQKHDAAMACFWRAIALEPGNVEAWHNAANTLLDLQRYDEAEEVLKTSLSKGPQIADTWVSLSRLLLARKQYAAAEASFGRAIALRPDNEVRLQRAALWLERDRLEDALNEYIDLQKIMPDKAAPHSGAGQALIGLEQLDAALPHLQKGIKCDPAHLDGQLGLARWHLLRGDFTAGWEQYEWRLKRWTIKPAEFSGPEWDGSDPAGKSILVYGEQGFGDTIQFLRYIPLLAKRGARVIVFCQKALVPLVERIEGVSYASCVRNKTPDYDCHIALLSLPHKMNMGEDPIPAEVPYIRTPRQAHFPNPPLGTKLKVGLVWAGSSTHPDDHNRSIGLSGLLPLAGIPGVRLYSLQVGPRADDVNKLAHPALIQDFSKHLKTFADTAAVISELDLVIAVDTAVAHLAGAMGKPAWVMVPSVPDWRWQMERDDTPWYPTMSLYRQTADRDWQPAINHLIKDLQDLADKSDLKMREPETVKALSIFALPDGQSRFVMEAPRSLLKDPGIGFLMRKERAGIGYEYATRAFLDAHLKLGDVFLDIGAHWGIMSLHAATHQAEDVNVVAFEPAPHNISYLKQWIGDNKCDDKIEVIGAAVSDSNGRGALRPESTMGHSLVRMQDGTIPVVSIDSILAERPALKGRRIIVKIDVEGQELEVISGMRNVLDSGKVSVIIWERGVEYSKPEGKVSLDALLGRLNELGFTSWRFVSEDLAGPLVPFVENGSTGNIISVASDIVLNQTYGSIRPDPIAQPEDPLFDMGSRALALFHEGTQSHMQGKTAQALKLYGEAAALDGRMSELYNNLGVMVKDSMPAARTASYWKAHRLAPKDSGILSNLGNALREEGDFNLSQDLQSKAQALAPSNIDVLYNAALVHRDMGQTDKALSMFERVLAAQQDHHDCAWDRALILLQKGDYARGMPAYEARWNIKRAYKRSISLPRWDGSPLEGRSIYLHDEQGFGDVMQFARFIPELKKHGAGKVVLECQPQLMRLMINTPGVDAVIPRERFMPQCDVYSPLLSLPGLLGATLETLPNEVPYLFAPDMAPETRAALPEDKRLKLGLVWAGQLVPRDRSCPLEKLLPILNDPRFAPISLQVGGRSNDLKALGADTFITDMSPYLHDFAETAAVLEQLDLLITIDTSVAHLAGALGVPTFLLLRTVSDWRWLDHIETSPWYPSFQVFRQNNPRYWDEPVALVGRALKFFADTNYGIR